MNQLLKDADRHASERIEAARQIERIMKAHADAEAARDRADAATYRIMQAAKRATPEAASDIEAAREIASRAASGASMYVAGIVHLLNTIKHTSDERAIRDAVRKAQGWAANASIEAASAIRAQSRVAFVA